MRVTKTAPYSIDVVTQIQPAPDAIPIGSNAALGKTSSLPTGGVTRIVETTRPELGSRRQTVPASVPFHHTAPSPRTRVEMAPPTEAIGGGIVFLTASVRGSSPKRGVGGL